MKSKYPSQDRLRELFTYDEKRSVFVYAHKPYNKPHLLGRDAGCTNKRDGIYYLTVDGKAYPAKTLASIYLTGGLPVPVPHHTKWTQEILKSLVHYDPETGNFTRLQSAGGVKAGSRADYVENNGYRYVILSGKRFIAARLAWLYQTGAWPQATRILVKDGDTQNIAWSNLALPEWAGMSNDPKVKNAYDKHHRKSSPESYRRSQLKRDFGISLEQYQAAFVAQDGVCACCKKPETDHRNGKRKWLAVDHDHKDNSFRGLLCASCNNGLGRFDDSPDTLRRAADYLEAHAAKPKTNVIPLAGRIAGQKGS